MSHLQSLNTQLSIHTMSKLVCRNHDDGLSMHRTMPVVYCCYRWQKVKLTVTIVAVLLIIVYAIIAFTCSPTFHC
jgi:hypothetical protein